jgi:hypothetical protein
VYVHLVFLSGYCFREPLCDDASYFTVLQGQIVGVADTGLDYNSCFFEDADHPITSVTSNKNNLFPNHRKVL